MAVFSNTMTITDSSLSTISKELINKRTYKKELIGVEGTPLIVNGIASGFSNESYLKQENLSLPNTYDSVKITVECSTPTIEETVECCVWELKGVNKRLALYLNKSTIYVLKEDVTLIALRGIKTSLKSIKCTLEITPETCNLGIIADGERYSASTTLESSINFANYNTLLVGSTGENNFNFFVGDIDLASLVIYRNNDVEYSPSVENSFHFTKLMVSDGVYPLTDNSAPVLNHTFSFPIKEISRTYNNVLLTTTIGEEARLKIREMALYSEDDLGVHLFSRISDLNLDKGTNLDYNLIINVKIDLGVVNTVAFPEIVINKKEYPSFKDFDTVRKLYLYIITNLERMIRTNAIGVGNYSYYMMNLPTFLDIPIAFDDEGNPLPSKQLGINEDFVGTSIPMRSSMIGVGLNLPQTLCSRQDEINAWEDNFCATSNFANLKNRFYGNKSQLIFDRSLLSIEGSFTVSETGNCIYNPSTGNTIGFVSPASFYCVPLTNNWESKISFKTSTDILTNQTIMSFENVCTLQPLVLSIENGYCHLTIHENDAIQVNFDIYEKDAIQVNGILYQREDTVYEIGGTTYYGWLTINGETGEEMRYLTTEMYPIAASVIYDDEGNPIGENPGSTLYDIEGNTTTDRIEVTYYNTVTALSVLCNREASTTEIEGTTYYGWISENGEYEFFTTDMYPTISSALYDFEGRLTEGSIESVFSGTILDENLFSVQANTKYSIKLRFNGNVYAAFYSSPKINDQQVLNFVSSRTTGQISNLLIGSKYSGTPDTFANPFLGTLFLNEFNATFSRYNPYGELEETENYDFNTLIELFGGNLTDFYHIPTYNHSYFQSNNLCHLTSSSVLEILEGYLTGRSDYIDFNSNKGYSLSVKANLMNSENKIILAKGDLRTEEFYFVLRLESFTDSRNLSHCFIKFEYNLGEGDVVTLSYEISQEELNSFVAYPITLTFIITNASSPTISLYKDNKLLDSREVGGNTALVAHNYKLVNRLSENSEPYDQRIVQGIVGIEGMLDENSLYYLNTILNTNF